MVASKAKILILGVFGLTCSFIFLSLKKAVETAGVTHTVNLFKENSRDFVAASLLLKIAVARLDRQDTTTLVAARDALRNCRMSYKKIEFFLDYFFESESLIYNKPAKVEVEEPFIEYQEPSGFQVIEVMLYTPDPAQHRDELIAQSDLIYSSASDLNAMLYGFAGNDKEIMESLRLALVKVITLSITGYDAPELKSGIDESRVCISAMNDVLKTYLTPSSTCSAALSSSLCQTIAYLKLHPDFDSFNRMEFLTEYALPLQEHLADFIQAKKLDLNEKSALHYSAKNIYSPDALLSTAFGATKGIRPGAADLGKKLFSEKALSGNLQRSCASCHKPDHYFSDGLKTSLAIDGKTFVQRNAPTLLYASFQYAQFWDGRAGNLDEQIKQVIASPMEMNGNHEVVLKNLRGMYSYRKEFRRAFPEFTGEVITIKTLSEALADYLRTLSPRNSDFDRYMAGNKNAMNTEQLKGFNLFMGKGQCGSCHFAPLFNGLIPPLYKRTEFEILGTPGNDDFNHLKADTDNGRAGFFPIVYYQAAFKTPTVRNVDKTGPYMHNGVFKDLEKVVEFYNQGGGAGLHLNVPQQTLSPKPLHLTDKEVQQIVVFMQSLTDH